MSSNRDPITIIEVDMDYCSLTFGTSPCTAALSPKIDRKCFNSFYTCKDQENYNKTTITYRFVEPRSKYPKTGTTFPCLISVSTSSAQANIAGADDKLNSLGKRGKVTAEFSDFPYHDRFSDKYQAERISGDAEFNGVGYQPIDRGTFWTKFKARNPNYTGRPFRKITGFIQDGVLTVEKTRHFVITNIIGPSDAGRVSIEAKDILKLADDDRAVAPKQSRGKLKEDISDAAGISFELNPSGIGSEYAASGMAVIGSEVVSFTRTGDTVTLTGRGQSLTKKSAHEIDDTFQETFSPRLARIDAVIYDLLINYANIDPSFITYSDWQDEVTRWAFTLNLTADITKPEGVSKLIGELASLGVTIWWDDATQKINLRTNRPVDSEVVYSLSDRNNNIMASQEDRADDRITEVIFNTVQIDPTKGVSETNFTRGNVIIAAVEKLPQAFGDTRIKKINSRWLNHGDDANVRILSLRMLDRFRLSPVRFVVVVDYRDDLSIGDVASLDSRIITNDTGELQPTLAQVIMRQDEKEGNTVRLTLQTFPFDKRYGFITENTRPLYSASSEAQKARGAYIIDEVTLVFGDGGGGYRII